MEHEQQQAASKTQRSPDHKKEKIAGGGVVGSFVLFLLSAGFNYFGSNPRILYIPAAGLCLFILYGTHVYVRSEIAKRQPAKNSAITQQQVPSSQPNAAPTAPAPKTELPRHKVAPRKLPKSPLISLSDGQRYLLKKKLESYASNTVRLVLIGHDPQQNIVFEQLADIFKDSGWNTQTVQIGMVGVVGANFPSHPYLTSSNIAAPLVVEVFSIFSSVGIDLPLTPRAFTGPNGSSANIIIVLH
jgi:hypothetical protein